MQVLEHLSWLDGAVVLVYLCSTALLGLAFHRQGSTTEFLLANRGMGWLPVGLSVMATLFSANAFLMVPGEAFRHNLLLGGVLVGTALTAPLVLRWIIPIYIRSGCSTAYELLETRFDVRVRVLAASLFILLRTGWMAAATFSCCLAVSVISGSDLLLTIWIMGLVTTAYTATGGIKAVMWNDVIQFGVFTVAIVAATCIAITNVPGGWSGTWSAYESAGKLRFVDPRLDLSLRMGTWALVIGQFIEMLSAYAADQSLVQRYLTAKSIRVCRRAFMANIAGVMVVIPGLMILGAALSSFYQAHPERLAAAPTEYFLRKPSDLVKATGLVEAMADRNQTSPAQWIRRATTEPDLLRADLAARYAQDPRLATLDLYQVDRQDEAMPVFVRQELPPGLIGLVVAALLAATMSSLSSGIHSIATSIVVDFRNRFGRAPVAHDADQVRFIRRVVLLLGLVATLLACVVGRLGPVFDMNKKLNGSFSGPLLAVFMLAFFSRRARTLPVLLAAAMGTGLTVWLTSLSELKRLPGWLTSSGTISPMWFCVFGFLSTWAIGYLVSLLSYRAGAGSSGARTR